MWKQKNIGSCAVILYFIFTHSDTNCADISGDILFHPDSDYLELDIDNFDINHNSVICSYSSSTSISWWKGSVEVSGRQFDSAYQVNGRIYFPGHVALTDSGDYSCKVNASSNLGEKNLLVCIIASASTPSSSTVPACNPTSTPFKDVNETTRSSITITTVNAETSKTNLSETTQKIKSTTENLPNNTGLIAGAAVGVVVLIAIIGIVFYFHKRSPKNVPESDVVLEESLHYHEISSNPPTASNNTSEGNRTYSNVIEEDGYEPSAYITHNPNISERPPYYEK
ncbi:uncharacterized protein LOC144420837 [Styela clava]